MKAIAFDTETHLIQPGLAAPPVVCGSFAIADGAYVAGREHALGEFRRYLEEGAHLIGANTAFDMCVLAGEEPDLIPLVFRAYDQERVHDVLINQSLDAIANGYLRESQIVDPRTGSFLRDPESGKQVRRYSLKACTDLMLGKVLAKKDTYRMRYATLDGVPLERWPQEAIDYARDDARNTFDVWAEQTGRGRPLHQWDTITARCAHCAEEISYSGNTPVCPSGNPRPALRNLHDAPRQVYAAFCGALASVQGMRTDPAMVEQLDATVQAKHKIDHARFEDLGLYRKPGGINPDTGRKWTKALAGKKDTALLKEMVTRAYLGKPPRTPPSDTHPDGQVSLSRETLEESGDDLLVDFAGGGFNEKLRTTYLPVLRQGTSVPINPGFNPLVSTGRTSYYEPNLQNLPRNGGVRECYIARPGKVFCSVDYATLELATLAQVNLWLFGWSRLAEALQAGQDCHSRLAARIQGTDYHVFLALLKAKDPAAKALRQTAKPVNFGLPGGMGVPKLVATARKDGVRFCVLAGAKVCGVQKTIVYTSPGGKQYDIAPTCCACIELAETYKALWFQEWEEMRYYFSWVGRQVESEPAEIIQWKSKRVRGGLGFCDGANTSFQGLAADGAKQALVRLTRECYLDTKSPLYGSRPLVFVHDEVIAELPEERAHEAALRMSEIMVGTMREWVPDVPIKAEPALCRRWFKGAEAVYTKGGLLRPWWPKDWAFPTDQEAMARDLVA